MLGVACLLCPALALARASDTPCRALRPCATPHAARRTPHAARRTPHEGAQKMLMYCPMRLRWSCEMHSPIQTMFLISCSLSFTKA